MGPGPPSLIQGRPESGERRGVCPSVSPRSAGPRTEGDHASALPRRPARTGISLSSAFCLTPRRSARRGCPLVRYGDAVSRAFARPGVCAPAASDRSERSGRGIERVSGLCVPESIPWAPAVPSLSSEPRGMQMDKDLSTKLASPLETAPVPRGPGFPLSPTVGPSRPMGPGDATPGPRRLQLSEAPKGAGRARAAPSSGLARALRPRRPRTP